MKIILVALIVSLVLAGCAVPMTGGMSESSGMEMPGHNMDTAAVPPFDQMFIDMMVPHHESAVVMAEVALERGEHPELVQLAEQIIAAQDPEIEQMRAWRQAWYGSSETPPMDQMPMLHPMPGTESMESMDMAAEVERLRQAEEPFDLAFIDAMIVHHQGAIDAARLAEAQAERQEIKNLARAIIDGQQQEIDQMNAWREAWYGEAEASEADTHISHGGDVDDSVSLVDALRAAGATVEPAAPVEQSFFSVPGQVIQVNGEDVQVFAFADADAAQIEAEALPADGTSFPTLMVTWMATPHFYQQGQIIVLYIGDNEEVQTLLADVLGAQIAGR
jgi:uncharacterized protein (DUF305 family)